MKAILGLFLVIVIASCINKPPPPPDPEYDAAMLAVYAAKQSQRNPDNFVRTIGRQNQDRCAVEVEQKQSKVRNVHGRARLHA